MSLICTPPPDSTEAEETVSLHLCPCCVKPIAAIVYRRQLGVDGGRCLSLLPAEEKPQAHFCFLAFDENKAGKTCEKRRRERCKLKVRKEEEIRLTCRAISVITVLLSGLETRTEVTHHSWNLRKQISGKLSNAEL